MSSNSFEHRPNKSNREVGDAPSIGYVPRMHKGGESRAGRHTREQASVGPSKSLVWMIGGGIAGVAVLGTVLAIWVMRPKGKGTTSELAIAPLSQISKQAATVPLAPSPDEAALLRTVETFLAARTPADLEALIRPSSQDPAAMIGKLENLDKVDGEMSSLRYLGPIDSRAVQIEGVVVNFEGGRNRLALLSPDSAGKWLVDFDAFDRYSTPDWDTLMSGKAVTGTVRIFCSQDSYYNGLYADESKWACFAMASPDHETLMFGYVQRDSERLEAMLKGLNKDGALTAAPARGQSNRLTLEISHKDGAQPRQFEITKLLSDEWVVGEIALEDKLARPLSSGEN